MLMTPYTTSGAASMRISLSMLLYSMAFSYLVATLVAPDCRAPLLHAQPLVALFEWPGRAEVSKQPQAPVRAGRVRDTLICLTVN